MSDEVQRALGRIEGKLDAMQKTQSGHDKKLDTIDKRVRSNEVKAARNGAIGGTVMSAAVMLLKSTLS